MNKTKEMLKEIMFLAADEIENRIQENKIDTLFTSRNDNRDNYYRWKLTIDANYDIKKSIKDLKAFEDFISIGYINLINALHYAIIELREWNPESEAATKLEEILKSFQ